MNTFFAIFLKTVLICGFANTTSTVQKWQKRQNISLAVGSSSLVNQQQFIQYETGNLVWFKRELMLYVPVKTYKTL